MRKQVYISIGSYCRNYRVNKLKMTLREVEGNEQIKTLSGFENGRSSNLDHLIKYVVKCDSIHERLLFLEGLIDVIEEV